MSKKTTAGKSEVGKAVLFIYHTNGKVNADEFLEVEGKSDPYHRALGLWESCCDDFPGAIHAIGMNDRARDLMTNTRMAEMGFEGYDATDQPTGSDTLPRPASCGARICTADRFGPHQHGNGVVSFDTMPTDEAIRA